MFELILAGFSGSLFSYLVAMECGVLLSNVINKYCLVQQNKQTKNIKFKIEELREELLYVLNDVKHEIKNEIKTKIVDFNSKNSDNTSHDTKRATIGEEMDDFYSDEYDAYNGSEFFEKKSSNSGEYSGERSSMSNDSCPDTNLFTDTNDPLPKKSKLSRANLQTLENEVHMFLKTKYNYPLSLEENVVLSEYYNCNNNKKKHYVYNTSENNNPLDIIIRDLCLQEQNIQIEDNNILNQEESDTQLFHIKYNEIPKNCVDFVENDEIISNEIGMPPTLQQSNKSHESYISQRIKIKIRDNVYKPETSQNTIDRQPFISKYTPNNDNESIKRIVGDFN